MIELHISPGHSWNVWETKGGLQPSVEDLDIPRPFLARFKGWDDKWRSAYWPPKFTGRKEYEAEGRKIADDLKKSVGKRFQIVFRHFVSFDKKKWRTQWREVNLTTKKQTKFWINDDLPDELAVKVVKVYPDFGGSYLWDLDGCCIGNKSLKFSDSMDEKFTEWANLWNDCYDVPKFTLDTSKLAAEKCDETGISLAAELKRSVGEAVRVIYLYTLKKSTVEVFADGRTVKLPRNTDFRQWALDQRGR